MLEILLVAFILLWATMLFAKYLVVEIWAVKHGQESPRLARRDAREQLARQWGRPTVAQAVEARLVRRIENPPERRWLVQARALVSEVFADSIAEARIRHHVNSRKRAMRHAGVRFQTGGATAGRRATPPPPPPPPDDDVARTWRCDGCEDELVPERGALCPTCQAGDPAAADPDPGPDPPEEKEQHDPAADRPGPPDHDTTEHHDGKDPLMATATHRINVDVNDPCTALQYAQNSRGFVDGVVGQFEILASNLRNAKVGPAPIGEVNVMADAGRTFSASLGDSVKEYAEYVVIQAELHSDPDLRDTVQDTFLDGDGAAVTAAPPPTTPDNSISAVDCHTPEAAKLFMEKVVEAFDFLRRGAEHVKGAHEVQGLDYDPVTLLAAQLELATQLAGQATRSAETFAAHISKRADTIGKKEAALGGTQDGKYLTGARR